MTPVVWKRVAEMRRDLDAIRAAGEPVVLVPTMGDLHEGHLALVRAGLEFGRVVVSIFVNPTQFAPGEDYDRYPRRLDEDLAKLATLGIAGVFAPEPAEMYPEGESTRVDVLGLTDVLCGAHRKGHFLGVTTICAKLFLATGCDLAVFGQKDAQQCLVIRRMVHDLGLRCDLLFVPTVREEGGVAMSSRNRYLEGEERGRARALSRALAEGRRLLEAGERSAGRIEDAMLAELRRDGLRPDYAEVRRVPDLAHPELVSGRVLLAAAAWLGRARLIDNLSLEVGDLVREAPLLDEHAPAAVAARRARWNG